MTSREIIDALGGYRVLAVALGQKLPQVHNWTRRAIPPRFWPQVIDLASGSDNPDAQRITVELLERTWEAWRETVRHAA